MIINSARNSADVQRISINSTNSSVADNKHNTPANTKALENDQAVHVTISWNCMPESRSSHCDKQIVYDGCFKPKHRTEPRKEEGERAVPERVIYDGCFDR